MHARPTLFALLTAMAVLASSVFAAEGNPIGEFDGHGDVGSPKIAGSASYDPDAQEYTITGSGTNMWASRDEFQFVWKKLRGDFILRTRVEFVGKGVEEHRKVGWIVRPSLDADAPYVDCAEHGSGLTSLQFRRTKGGATRQFILPIDRADVLQFERRGNKYIFSAAQFGEPFVSSEISDLDLGDDVFAGLFVCAHNPKVKETAVFRDVRIVRPAKPNFVPYRDYIGSVLEMLDVRSGNAQVLYRSAEPIEAPNWTHDRAALIYNVSGSGPRRGILERFDLATLKPSVIDTGFATHNNNDHVLSFDGAMLGISNQGPETHNRSAVFVVPTTGGTPRQVTPLTPSYFHGWSPDGKWLVYAGGRPEHPGGPDVYSIYKIPLEGGNEIRLTDPHGRDDGPEFSPDGRYIYFNSSRSGRMQIWRMKPDGTSPEQMTSDEFNDWFPHLSPDGRWIAFLSYPADVRPDDHPYYKHVYLQVMPVENGRSHIVAYVYGGQGTMNVPSWSPDSRHLAYVSNTDMR